MHQLPDLGPLTVTREGQTWRFHMSTQQDVTLELPPNYDQHLSEELRRLFNEGGTPIAVIELSHLPAISSRQLGLMLALRKILSDYDATLRVEGASPDVRRLLRMTRTEQFFELV